MTTTTTTLLTGLCRPTTCATVHAVEAHRSSDELDGGPELALCGAVVSVADTPWTPTAPGACPACACTC
ncbi:hypothetical protein SAMN05660199_03847 [Klenkia soli]|uniref:Uncharacterized protein n=1 Tax=Klenkia soli TaxID=1052260 RepID=A0A1H0SI60_9ACTN|nr:hypothetical protein [Klenkia soli]SDP41397.1 hypothetical protein SAMN05660199_03847 [Klenkia soli]